MKLIQCHSHIFNAKDISNGFLGFKLPFTFSFLHTIEGTMWLMATIGKLFGKKKMGYYKQFMDCFDDSTMQSVYNKLKSYDKEPTVHVGLAMDTISIKGDIKTDITDQIIELGEVKKNDKDFLFFIAIDPNRPKEQITQLLLLALNCGASGYKLYPSLGYLPTHPNLMEVIYPFCVANNWPITAHCSSAITRSSAKRLHIKGLDENGCVIDKIQTMWNKEAYRQLNNPAGYISVFREFPTLRINFAHFGGEEIEKMNSNKPSWCNTILMLMSQYDGVFADISYSFSNRTELLKIVQLLATVKIFKERCLLGTDFYMVLLEGDFAEMLENLYLCLGVNNLDRIGRKNPRKFLANETIR